MGNAWNAVFFLDVLYNIERFFSRTTASPVSARNIVQFEIAEFCDCLQKVLVSLFSFWRKDFDRENFLFFF